MSYTTTPERIAENACVAWCRKQGAGSGWVCREWGGLCRVVNVNRSEPVPGGRSWERRDMVKVQAPTWTECAQLLQIDLAAAIADHRATFGADSVAAE